MPLRFRTMPFASRGGRVKRQKTYRGKVIVSSDEHENETARRIVGMDDEQIDSVRIRNVR